MENQETIKTANKPVKNKRLFKWLIVLVILAAIITAAIVIPSVINSKRLKEEEKAKLYTVTYTSISNENDRFDVYFNINSSTEKIINASDFSVQIGGLPVVADRVFVESWLLGQSTSLTNGMVIVRFNCKLSTIDRPIKFYYQGKELPLGVAVQFEQAAKKY